MHPLAAKWISKAFLQEHQISVPRTHDLVELLALCQDIEPTLILIEPELKSLNGFAVGIRYPGQTVYKEDAVQAVRQATIVRRELRRRLGLSF